MTVLRFLFHTRVTVPPFPAPRSPNTSKSSSFTRSSPFLSFDFRALPTALFFLLLEDELSLCAARCVGVDGKVDGEVGGD